MAKKPKIKIKQGNILLAEPFMTDPSFKQAAILLTDYHKTGSVGFILNKPIDLKVNDILASFPEIDSDVYFGGPVATDTIHYLHNVGNLLEGSNEVMPGIYWGGDYEKMKFLVRSELIKPHQIKFFVGYSGWSPAQLEEEIENGSWVISEGDVNYVFKSGSNSLWKQVMIDKGEIFSIISEMPENYNMN